MSTEERAEAESRNTAFQEWTAERLQQIERTKGIAVIDHKPSPVESFKGNWHVFEVEVQLPDKTYKSGFMQGDGYGNWAVETFEESE